ncbi:MAG: hypothetical protein R2932_40590 [Caldilineaceae bacterium]
MRHFQLPLDLRQQPIPLHLDPIPLGKQFAALAVMLFSRSLAARSAAIFSASVTI